MEKSKPLPFLSFAIHRLRFVIYEQPSMLRVIFAQICLNRKNNTAAIQIIVLLIWKVNSTRYEVRLYKQCRRVCLSINFYTVCVKCLSAQGSNSKHEDRFPVLVDRLHQSFLVKRVLLSQDACRGAASPYLPSH